MPDLPALTLSQAHYDRVVATFPGATPTAKAAAYKAWLTGHLLDHATTTEARRIDEAANTAKAAELATLAAALPPRPASGAPPPAPAPESTVGDAIVRAEDYGVAADGATNDRPALNDAAIALGPNGGVILLPVGIVGVRGTVIVPANVTLRGHGHRRSIIRSLTGAASGSVVQIAGDNASVEDVGIEVNARPGSIGVIVTPTAYSVDTLLTGIAIRRIRVKGSTGDSIRVPNPVHDFTLDGCTIEGGAAGFSLYAPSVASGHVSAGILITGNRFRRTGGNNCQLYGGSDPTSLRITGATITGNDFRDFAQTGPHGPIPIEPTGIRDLVVAGNIIVGPSTRGISMGNNRNVSCVGNIVREQSIYAFELNGGSNYTITGNTVERCNSFAHETGTPGAPNRLTDVLINGNTFAGTMATATLTGGADVIKLPTARRVRVIGNTFTDWQYVRSCIRVGESTPVVEDCLIADNSFTITDVNTPLSTVVVRKATRTIVRDNRVTILRDLTAADDYATALTITTDPANVDTLLDGNEVIFTGVVVVPNRVAGIGNGEAAPSAAPSSLRVLRNRVHRATWGMRFVTSDGALQVRDNDVSTCANGIHGASA